MRKDYATGYGKPPRASQFKPGQSGNPKGRPKGAKNVATIIQQELDRPVLVNENGKRRRISKRRAIAKQLVNKAAAGDPKAIPIILNADRDHRAEGAAGATHPFDRPEDQLVMESIIRRIRLAASEAGQPSPGPETPPHGSISPKSDNAGE